MRQRDLGLRGGGVAPRGVSLFSRSETGVPRTLGWGRDACTVHDATMHFGQIG
jgi:hypothetical protein